MAIEVIVLSWAEKKNKSKKPSLFLSCTGIRHVPYSAIQEIGNEYCWSGVCRGKGRAHSQKKRGFMLIN